MVQPTLLSEEVAATWFATAMLIAVMGFTFSSREEVSADTRRILDLLFLCLAFYTILWTMLSYMSILSFFAHRLGVFILFLATLGTLIYLIYLASLEFV